MAPKDSCRGRGVGIPEMILGPFSPIIKLSLGGLGYGDKFKLPKYLL
jgi:hypothetical protein